MKQRYQEGGEAEEQQPDPMGGLASIFAVMNQGTPEAQRYAREILDQYQSYDFTSEEELLEKFRETAEESRAALSQARERILAEKYDPRAKWLAAAAAFGAPTKTGQFGETIGNVAGALGPEVEKENLFRRKQDQDALALQQQMTEVDQNTLMNEFKLQEMRRKQQTDLAGRALTQLGKPTPGAPTSVTNLPSIKKLDQVMATEYQKWASGGQQDVQFQMANLDLAISELENPDLNISGPWMGLMPKMARDVFFPESANVQETIETVAQRSLKAILGGQFGQREGEMLLERTFNPRLKEKTNRDRAFRLLQNIKLGAAEKQRAMEWFQDHATMAGYDGKTSWTLDDFIPDEPVLRKIRMPDKNVVLFPRDWNQKEMMEYYQETGGGFDPEEEAKAEGGRVQYAGGGGVKKGLEEALAQLKAQAGESNPSELSEMEEFYRTNPVGGNKPLGGQYLEAASGSGKNFEAGLAEARGEPVLKIDPRKPKTGGIQKKILIDAEEYSGKNFTDMEVVRDPRNRSMYAVRTVDTKGEEWTFLYDMDAQDPMDAIEEVEFTSWPPTSGDAKPMGNFAGGGRVGYQEGGEAEDIIDFGEADAEEFSEVEEESFFSGTPVDVGVTGAGALAGAGIGLGTEAAGTKLYEMYNELERPPRSEQLIGTSMEAGGVEPDEMIAEVKRGRRMGVPERAIDKSGPITRELGARAIMGSGDIGALALEELETRHEGSKQRVGRQVEKGLKTPEFYATEGKMTERLYTRASPLYKQAYKENPSVQMPPFYADLVQGKYGVEAVEYALDFMELAGKPIGRENAVGIVQRPSLEFLDQLKRGWDQMIRKEEAMGHTPLGKLMRDQRKKLVSWLDNPENVTGTYQKARAQYKGDLEVLEALDTGRTQFHRMPPEEAREMMQTMSRSEVDAMKTGVAQHLYDVIYGPTSDISTARRVIGSPDMRRRLQLLFNKPSEYRIFEAAMERELDLYEKGKKLISKSESGRTRRQIGDVLNIDDPLTAAKDMMARGPIMWALRTLGWGGRSAKGLTEKESDEIVQILMTRDVKELEKYGPKLEYGRNYARTRQRRRGRAAMVGAGVGAALAAASRVGAEEEDDTITDEQIEEIRQLLGAGAE